LILVTDLLDAEQYPAADLLAAYLARWGIERMFQQVTEVFALKRLIGGSPQAGVFQLAFCLLLYNMIHVLRA
jgi:IS4 transposase